MWWPNGYGPQKLYPLSAVFSNGKQENEKRIQIGFREAKLIQERVNKKNAKQGRPNFISDITKIQTTKLFETFLIRILTRIIDNFFRFDILFQCQQC